MHVMQWFSLVSQQKKIPQSVTCLTGSSYPLLFCTQLISYIHRNLNQPMVSMQVAEYELHQLKAQLEMAFLGQPVLYWLHSFDELPKQKRDEWFSYLHTYKGPNSLIFFSQTSSSDLSPEWDTIQIPEYADKTLSLTMLSWINNTTRHGVEFIERLYQFEKHVPLDTAVLLVRYAILSGSNQDQFFKELLHKIIEPSNSLFSLSQALLGKSKQQFFRQWSQVSDYYVPQFWISFWSEQLWRAYAYARLSKSGKYAEAKKISYRLPFSYLNRDWRRYSLAELQRAHNFLYSVDFSLKNGGHSFALDLFISKFLSGAFA